MQPEPHPKHFPLTRHSLFAALRSSDGGSRSAALERLARSYWGPMCAYLVRQRRISAPDAEDLAQAFFQQALEQQLFERWDPARARFQSWLRLCLDSFVANHFKALSREKRGGAARRVSLETGGADGEALEIPDAQAEAAREQGWRREWVRELLRSALARVEEHCTRQGKLAHYHLLVAADLEEQPGRARQSYAELGASRGLSVSQVTNHLFWARALLRRFALEELALRCDDEQEFQLEARALFGLQLDATQSSAVAQFGEGEQ